MPLPVSALEVNHEKFSVGEVKKIHKIEGLPDTIEYVVAPAFYEAGLINYHIEGADVSFDSFHQALMASLCGKYDSMEAAPYVWRLLKQEK